MDKNDLSRDNAVFSETMIVSPTFSAADGVPQSVDIYDEDSVITPKKVPGFASLKYIPFGVDDQLPYRLQAAIGKDEILSQNMFFNILTLCGAGLRYADRATGEETEDPDIERFAVTNSIKEFAIEQATDMKYYFFCVAVVILNKARTAIVKVRHKDACYCRFSKADAHGRIKYLLYANWRQPSSLTRRSVECIPLLDEKNPLGDLRVRLGLDPGDDGECRPRCKDCKFAVVMRFPTPGMQYYPTPYYTSLFRGDWVEIKNLIGRAKRAKLRNISGVKYHVEIHSDFFPRIFEAEGIRDPLKQEERRKQEKERIRDFVCGIANLDKIWFTGYYTDPQGNEVSMVKITRVDTKKEGGDWSEDIQEAANMTCYATNIHPNLVGATPGKTQTNNSGSDKRELFTLKQSLETAFRDMMVKVHNLIIFFNGWHSKVRPVTPLILLTTLDKNTDATMQPRPSETTDE